MAGTDDIARLHYLSAAHQRALHRAAEKMVRRCEWRLDDPDQGTWESSCGCAFNIIEGGPEQNDMRFCCYCGDPLKEIKNA